MLCVAVPRGVDLPPRRREQRVGEGTLSLRRGLAARDRGPAQGQIALLPGRKGVLERSRRRWIPLQPRPKSLARPLDSGGRGVQRPLRCAESTLGLDLLRSEAPGALLCPLQIGAALCDERLHPQEICPKLSGYLAQPGLVRSREVERQRIPVPLPPISQPVGQERGEVALGRAELPPPARLVPGRVAVFEGQGEGVAVGGRRPDGRAEERHRQGGREQGAPGG